MDSKEWWKDFGKATAASIFNGEVSTTVEELYQHFAERFRRENRGELVSSPIGDSREKYWVFLEPKESNSDD